MEGADQAAAAQPKSRRLSLRKRQPKQVQELNWLERSVEAIDKNASLIRRVAIAVIFLITLNPLILITMRGVHMAKLPETFCEDFVVDLNSTDECTTDKENTGLFLSGIMVSGRSCKGSLNKHFYHAPIISVWASNAFDLTQDEVIWHLLTSPAQAGLNSLYPTSKKQWSWVVKSDSDRPRKSPMSAISTVPGAVNLVACLETNPDISIRKRGMQMINPDFRSFCANIATWCGSVCNYAGNVSMPTCSNNHIVGPEWAVNYFMECKEKPTKDDVDEAEDMLEDYDVHSSHGPGTVRTLDMRFLASVKKDKDDEKEKEEQNETLVFIGDGTNVSWTSNNTHTCSWHWFATEDSDTTSIEFDLTGIDPYDLYAIAFTVFFDGIMLLSFLPLLPSYKKFPHHGLYSKRILEFQHGLHDLKFMEMLKAGNVRALVFLTARVREGDFEEHMQSTCETMLILGNRLVKAGTAKHLKLIVKVIDEDRKPDAFEEMCVDPGTGMMYYRTNLLKMVEKLSQDPKCAWFPSDTPTLQTPPPGGHYRIYSRNLSEFVQFEFHYLRRGWRIERERTWFEQLFGFGERGVVRAGDHVVYNNGPGEENGLGEVLKVSYFGGVTIKRERTGLAAKMRTADDDALAEEDEIQVPRACVRKMIDGAGKGVALGVAYDLLRQSVMAGVAVDFDNESGNILTCILDARHHITAKNHFWNTLLGTWWVEEDWGFDDELQYVQVAQNLLPPEHYFLGQQNRMWYSFLSTLLSTVGAVTSSGSGSITKIPLDNNGFKKFKEACLALRSNTEDYLQAIIMLSRGGTGAYVCNYSYTTAKGKDTMLSAYLRWEGGNFAVSSKAIILRQAMLGLLTLCVTGLIIAAPLAALLWFGSWEYTAFAALITMSIMGIFCSVITTTRQAYKFVHMVTVQQMCLRSLLNPFIGILGAFFLFSLPMITALAGHIPLQLDGVGFPWTLLIRAMILTGVQGFMYTGVLVTEWIRNDAQNQVLAVKSDVSLSSAKAIANSPMLDEVKEGEVDAQSHTSEAGDPRDKELDQSLKLKPNKAWNDATIEYCLQALYQLNQLTLQPGKGVMSFFRGVLEIISREIFNIDASGWVSGNVERVVFGIPVLNELFMAVVLYPYPTSLSQFLVFFVLTWLALTQAFVWVEEIIAPNLPSIFSDRQIKKTVQSSIVFCHIFIWFQLARLL